MNEGAKPWLTITPKVMGKVALSTVLMAIGMYYLTTGRREASVSRMFTGAFLALASVFLFLL
jgi:hypothetical protein